MEKDEYERVADAIVRMQLAFDEVGCSGPKVLYMQPRDFDRLRIMMLTSPVMRKNGGVHGSMMMMISGVLVRRASDDVRLAPWGV